MVSLRRSSALARGGKAIRAAAAVMTRVKVANLFMRVLLVAVISAVCR
jgi:hypothetical protein